MRYVYLCSCPVLMAMLILCVAGCSGESCPAHERMYNGTCVCVYGYERVGGECVPAGSVDGDTTDGDTDGDVADGDAVENTEGDTDGDITDDDTTDDDVTDGDITDDDVNDGDATDDDTTDGDAVEDTEDDTDGGADGDGVEDTGDEGETGETVEQSEMDAFIMPDFVPITAGTFWMGSPDGITCPEDYPGVCEEEIERFENERLHKVILTYDFEIGRFEITEAQFESLMGWNPADSFDLDCFYGCGGDNHPVRNVSWLDALAYANQLSLRAGLKPCYTIYDILCYDDWGYEAGGDYMNCYHDSPPLAGIDRGEVKLYRNVSKPQECEGYRLPTEAEWEYAIRAGDQYTALYQSIGNDGRITDSYEDPNLEKIAWYVRNTDRIPHPVGQKAANAWGLYDMSGNVMEWVWDSFEEDFEDVISIDPGDLGYNHSLAVAYRGGGFGSRVKRCRSAYRYKAYYAQKAPGLGFRLARSLPDGLCMPDPCHGHGRCNSDGSCSCSAYYAGEHCDQCAQGYDNYPLCNEISPQVSVGEGHACALLETGEVRCWGTNGWGSLGIGFSCGGIRMEASNVRGLPDPALEIVLGPESSCAVLTSQEVWCWGKFLNIRELPTHSPVPLRLEFPQDVIDIAVSINCTYALLNSGEVWCRGNRYCEMLSESEEIEDNFFGPVQIPELSNVRSIKAKGNSACALLASGKIWCWGGNRDGQLGNGTTEDSHTPVEVIGISNATTISMGGSISYASYAVLATGEVMCWGDCHVPDESTIPIPVPGLTGVTSIAAGSGHACALLNSGEVQCWGYNREGQLGDGTQSSREDPVTVTGLSDNAISIAAGGYYSCAQLASGQVQCWGRIAIGTEDELQSNVPVTVQGIP